MLNYQFHSDASTVMWPQTTQGHGQQQPSLSVVTTVWGVTSSMTNGTANMTHDPSNPGIPTTNTVNSVGHPYLSTSANPKPYAQQGKLSVFFFSHTSSACLCIYFSNLVNLWYLWFCPSKNVKPLLILFLRNGSLLSFGQMQS